MKFEFTSGAGNNIYIDDICVIGILAAGDIAVQGYSAEVYPNPAGSNSLLQIEVPKRTEVRYELIDLTGRQISVSAKTKLEAGSHELPMFNNLSSGLYFIKVDFGDFSLTRKLVIDK